jgi:hypothetical protein
MSECLPPTCFMDVSNVCDYANSGVCCIPPDPMYNLLWKVFLILFGMFIGYALHELLPLKQFKGFHPTSGNYGGSEEKSA